MTCRAVDYYKFGFRDKDGLRIGSKCRGKDIVSKSFGYEAGRGQEYYFERGEIEVPYDGLVDCLVELFETL